MLEFDDITFEESDTTDGSGGGRPVGSQCGNVPVGGAACLACVDEHCCAEAEACGAEPACVALALCRAGCASGDVECLTGCSSIHASGAAVWSALEACYEAPCGSACASTAGTGGSGGVAGSGGEGGSGGVAGSGGSSGTGGATGGTGGSGGCSIQSSDAACDACMHDRCINECVACTSNTECVSLLECINGCGSNSTCQNSCANQYPSGIDDLMAFLGVGGCLDTECGSACGTGGTGGSSGTGGTGGTGGSNTGGTGGTGGSSTGGTSGTGGSSTGGTSGTGGSAGSVAGHSCSLTDASGTGNEPGGIIPVCCAPTASEEAYIDEVFVLLNEHRQNNGVDPLNYDEELEAAIQGHCIHMGIHPFFDHTAPESSVSSPWTRASKCGTSANGENIANGQSSPAAVMNSWKNSSGHNANMLNGSFTRVGIGYYQGYWGQIFGM